MSFLFRLLVLANVFILDVIPDLWADDPEQTATEFSQKALTILKGPIAKLLGAVILLAGVASLLRGRHKIAISCAVAFVMLLFLPMLLDKVATGN